jgi:ATP-binding cassette subfamily F protein 3
MEDESLRDRDELKRAPTKTVQNRLANIKKRQTPRPVDVIITTLYEGLHVGEQLCRVERIAKAYGEQSLFADLSCEVMRGDRLAIVGANGSGKSTLLRVLSGAESPDTGRVVWPGNATFADFNALLAGLDPDDTVSHTVNVTPLGYSASRKLVHRFLSMLQFTEFDIKQRIGTLSGGQRARVALAQCLLSGAGALIMDEPTNHLDMTTIQVMERALVHFPGAIIVVSHDRLFIDKIATRLLVFDGEGGTRRFEGNWTMWHASGGESTDEKTGEELGEQVGQKNAHL